MKATLIATSDETRRAVPLQQQGFLLSCVRARSYICDLFRSCVLRNRLQFSANL